MTITRYPMLYVLWEPLGAGAPLAVAQAKPLPLDALGVDVKLYHPPEPIRPAKLKVNVDFYPPDPIDLAETAVQLSFHPPTPCYPPEPSWELTLAKGCCWCPGPGTATPTGWWSPVRRV
jgi:hypothetical protein